MSLERTIDELLTVCIPNNPVPGGVTGPIIIYINNRIQSSLSLSLSLSLSHTHTHTHTYHKMNWYSANVLVYISTFYISCYDLQWNTPSLSEIYAIP